MRVSSFTERNRAQEKQKAEAEKQLRCFKTRDLLTDENPTISCELN